MSNPQHLQLEISRNTAKTCADPACHRPRERISGFCKMHTRFRHLYGHPRGRWYNPKEYQPEHQQVSAFIDRHIEHPAIVAALKWLDEWITGAWMGNTALPGLKDLQRLYAHGVKALDILKVVTAVAMYSTRNPNALPDDLRLTYALSIAVMGLAPHETTPSPSKPGRHNAKRYTAESRRTIGEHLRGTITPLFINLSGAIHRLEEAGHSQHQALRIPF